jgi:hypothetical protein
MKVKLFAAVALIILPSFALAAGAGGAGGGSGSSGNGGASAGAGKTALHPAFLGAGFFLRSA